MTPRLNLDYKTESCGSAEESKKQQMEKGMAPMMKRGQSGRMKTRWLHVLGQLSRTTLRGNVQPAIGQQCIVMKGVAGQDEGQMGVVTNRSRVMVEVTVAHHTGKGTVTKRKQPSSLIMLEPGLGLVQDVDGTVWVRIIGDVGQQTKRHM